MTCCIIWWIHPPKYEFSVCHLPMPGLLFCFRDRQVREEGRGIWADYRGPPPLHHRGTGDVPSAGSEARAQDSLWQETIDEPWLSFPSGSEAGLNLVNLFFSLFFFCFFFAVNFGCPQMERQLLNCQGGWSWFSLKIQLERKFLSMYGELFIFELPSRPHLFFFNFFFFIVFWKF